jgi:hypothetical protein
VLANWLRKAVWKRRKQFVLVEVLTDDALYSEVGTFYELLNEVAVSYIVEQTGCEAK